MVGVRVSGIFQQVDGFLGLLPHSGHAGMLPQVCLYDLSLSYGYLSIVMGVDLSTHIFFQKTSFVSKGNMFEIFS